jgi:riboflavin biosynthesis pyrimidine reductase
LRYSELDESDLTRLYAFPAGPGGNAQPHTLRANMVTSTDGAATLAGASAGLSSAADRHVFALNRSLADVILVGASTARIEHYAPVRIRELWQHLRDGRTPTPPIAVITSLRDLDPANPLIADAPAHARTIIITTEQAPADARARMAAHADVIVAGETAVDLKAAIAALTGRGHRHILAEGGPGILAQLVAADLLDELCLTIGPLLAGPGAPRILTGTPIPQALPLSLAHVIEDNSFLLCRYSVGSAPRIS